MPHILKNSDLEVHIDLPFENYEFSRFDWTGKIAKVKFQDISLSTNERADSKDENIFGKGFYNEFGMDTPLGFEETEIGGWFHKIGIGLLKKDSDQYFFHKLHEIQPAEFKIHKEQNKISIICKSQMVNSYSYILIKEIELFENSFIIKYHLENRGDKVILTDEYTHNFSAVNNDPMGSNYVLKFPFQLKPELFGETVNPDGKVIIGTNDIKFNGHPEEQFFFSDLSGDDTIAAGWKLINLKNKIALSETGSFQTSKVNLWGWEHVVSPELFFKISIAPGQSAEWSRTYKVYRTV